MSLFTRAYFINGPRHGAIHDIPGRPHDYRVAEVNQDFTENAHLSTRHGIYTRTSPLRFDPSNNKPTSQDVCWIYEWAGYRG